MTKEEREVMRMALERLKEWVDHSDCLEDKQAITAIEKCLANDALEKKAENARELGLDYEPNDGLCQACDGDSCTAKKGCVAISNPLQPEKERPSFAEWTSDYVQDNLHKLKPEQEPVGLIESLKDAKPCCGEYETCWRACTPRGKFLGQRDAQRTWVGLTDEEVITMSRYDLEYAALIGEVQRRLKEKNTHD